jgi:dihydroflavonol-4-reductase
MVQRQRLPAVIVNPSTPIGPRDLKPTPTGRIIVEAASGRMPAFVDTGLNLVHVDDVARRPPRGTRARTIGERYILGGENVYLRDMLAEIRACGRPQAAARSIADRAHCIRSRSSPRVWVSSRGASRS